ncbi:HIV Tat-specific factor 1-like [Oopsacas minuta]|uniref:HIV Tat-specific factor 1-like n=1 Tax=Oopsacas minuta TaxID=111878 RepID=A0AAV7JHJ8_9METZ|nr:HIV Tat-specific factor 1-like [Oopsacas minuta]
MSTEQEAAVIEQEAAIIEKEAAVIEKGPAKPEAAVIPHESAAMKESPDNGQDSTQSVHTNTSFTDPHDGTIYEWDNVQRGWFPKINEDMIAAYTMSYGSCQAQGNLKQEADKPPTHGVCKKRELREESDPSKDISIKKVKNETPAWFEVEEKQNKHVYVSNLPSNTTEQQFIELMRKCGVIAENDDGKPKIKLYRTEDGELKGDGLCTYLKVDSVPYAELILDGYDMDGHKLKVQSAQFQMKGEYDASLKPKKGKKNKKNRADKLVKWKDPFYDRPKHERVVIVKNLFTTKEIAADPLLAVQVKEQIKTECEKCGKVKRAILAERHPEGVVSVMFLEHSDADKCVQMMHHRTFGGRVMDCSLWDGVTCYVTEETEEEQKSRLELWEDYLKK